MIFFLHCLDGERITNGQLCLSLWLYVFLHKLHRFPAHLQEKRLTFPQSMVKLPYMKQLKEDKITEGMCSLSVLIFLSEKRTGQLWKCVQISLAYAKTLTSLQRKFIHVSCLVCLKLLKITSLSELRFLFHCRPRVRKDNGWDTKLLES